MVTLNLWKRCTPAMATLALKAWNSWSASSLASLQSWIDDLKLFLILLCCKIIFAVYYHCLDCCDSVFVSGTWLSGRYTKMAQKHNSRTVYQHYGGRYCIFFGGHWKIESCDWMVNGDNSQGFAFSKVLGAVCPDRIGPLWRYFKYGVGGTYDKV